MITEDRVPFEIAKLLRDKGFEQDTVSYPYYTDNGNLFTGDVNTPTQRYYNAASAPTLQMAMKWLREVHKIFINVSNEVSLTDDDITYQFFVCTKEKSILHRGEDIKTFEDAANEAIKYTLENLI